jgi:hypothetical protein
MAFARIDLPKTARTNNIAGVVHALAHVALGFGWAELVLVLSRDVLPHGSGSDLVVFLIVMVGTPVVLGFLDAEMVALYLLVVSRYGINLNEVFAAQSIEDYKGFLRLHLSADGTLTIYPIKLPTVCRKWKADPDGAPTDPWLRPDGGALAPELIEAPITIPRAAG